MTLNCIIIDDDPAMISSLRSYTEQISFLNLLGTYQQPLDGLAAVEAHNVHLLIMDIGMPGINGLELANILNNQQGDAAPRIIFVSGFERFALDGYRVNALDYLLKPVSYEDFLKSVYKAKHYFESVNKEAGSAASAYGPTDAIFLRVEYELIRVYLKDILYIESFKDYIKVYTTDEKVYKALATMKCVVEKLPAHSFMRVHRSFMVSLDKIDAIHNNTIRIGKTMIPVTEQYRSHFKDFVQQWY